MSATAPPRYSAVELRFMLSSTPSDELKRLLLDAWCREQNANARVMRQMGVEVGR